MNVHVGEVSGTSGSEVRRGRTFAGQSSSSNISCGGGGDGGVPLASPMRLLREEVEAFIPEYVHHFPEDL